MPIDPEISRQAKLIDVESLDKNDHKSFPQLKKMDREKMTAVELALVRYYGALILQKRRACLVRS